MGDTRQKHRRNNTNIILDPTLNPDQPFLLFIPNLASLSVGELVSLQQMLCKNHTTLTSFRSLSKITNQEASQGATLRMGHLWPRFRNPTLSQFLPHKQSCPRRT